MIFAHPQLLWLLLVIPPLLALFFWWGNRVRQKLLIQFVEARLLSSLTVGLSPTRRKIRFGLVILAAALLVIAIARPQYGYDKEEVQQRGLDVVVAVDTSKSMLANDIAPNRLGRAKLAALELMQRAKTDRLGLVAFAGQAFLECPLTIDNTAFQQSVDALDVNSIPIGGTALAEAITTALDAFKEKGNHKALVLLTDGEDNDEGALEAAQSAAKEGLKIFTIGIGTAEGTLLNPNLVRDPEGNAVKSHLNEALLKQIAAATGGFYLPLRGANTMDLLYDNGLAPLPKSEGVSRVIRRYHEQYHWPLAAAMLLLLAEIFLPERRDAVRRTGPKSTNAVSAAPGAHLTAAALLLGVALLPAAARLRRARPCAIINPATSPMRSRNSPAWPPFRPMICASSSTPGMPPIAPAPPILTWPNRFFPRQPSRLTLNCSSRRTITSAIRDFKRPNSPWIWTACKRHSSWPKRPMPRRFRSIPTMPMPRSTSC